MAYCVARATKSTGRGETPPPSQKKTSCSNSDGWRTGCSNNENCELLEASSTYSPPLPRSVSPALRESCRISSCSPRWARDAISDTLSHAALTLKLPTLTHTHTCFFFPLFIFFFLRCHRTSHSPLITFQEIARTHPDWQINACVCVCKKKTRPEAFL